MDINAENGSSREKERDFNDLNDELAGRENTGRVKRFLSPEARAEVQEEKRRETEFHNLLQYLLVNDAEYRALFQKVSDRVNEIEIAVARALREANERIAEMEENAHTLDGKKVFFSRDGKRAYNEDGEEISAADMARITRSDDAPTWEDYDAAKRERDDITRYQDDVLNPIKERINDKENPVPKDELEGMLDDLVGSIPKTVHVESVHPDTKAKDIGDRSEKSASAEKYLNAPDVKTCFTAAACMDIPDLSPDATPAALPKPK